MEKAELMINDYVRVPSELHRLKQIRSTFDIDGAVLYEPIPLTEGFFKTNGFSLIEKSWLYQKGKVSILVKPCRNDYKLKVVVRNFGNEEKGHTNSRRWRIPDLRYVHELQHALRLCRRNELADTFELE